MIIFRLRFSKSFVFKIFSHHTKTKPPAFSNSSGLKSVFRKIRLCDGLECTFGLTVEIRPRFLRCDGGRKTFEAFSE